MAFAAAVSGFCRGKTGPFPGIGTGGCIGDSADAAGRDPRVVGIRLRYGQVHGHIHETYPFGVFMTEPV